MEGVTFTPTLVKSLSNNVETSNIITNTSVQSDLGVKKAHPKVPYFYSQKPSSFASSVTSISSGFEFHLRFPTYRKEYYKRNFGVWFINYVDLISCF